MNDTIDISSKKNPSAESSFRLVDGRFKCNSAKFSSSENHAGCMLSESAKLCLAEEFGNLSLKCKSATLYEVNV